MSQDNRKMTEAGESYEAVMAEYSGLSDTDLENIKEDLNVSEIRVGVASAILNMRRKERGYDEDRNPASFM